ncbi:SAM-dependent methyltransferase [Duganella sp. 1411]|jgi:SAM-dependent methyltransferase|uniref:class I SAM-dependent methyltransferase n=1 Tax=Duganella sp. 1411 TaxID=2806572 RepID=UPI001AE5212C|nr:methyltransferase domain-containing protein [Duganella sp. 1411]MBP1202287.1 SAM-dependent methyltransferase [Duganella sp. 1411]
MTADTDLKATVLVDHYRATAASDKSHVAYQGLPIHALPGLHEFAFEQFRRHAAPGAGVLELAAGSGAMSRRLADAGYRVTATDYVRENFRLHGAIPFFTCDLNQNFSDGRAASEDHICALEIIEHLENPRHFARQCFQVLKPGGTLLLSTPNLDTAASVAMFMRDLSFQWFAEDDYARDGHITPLSQWQLQKCFAEAGFTRAWEGSVGDPYGRVRGSPRMLWLARAIDLLMRRERGLRRQIYVALYQKPGNPG